MISDDLRAAIMAFDWDWSDRYDNESARSQALTHRPSATAVLASVVQADAIISFGIGANLAKEHPVAQLWLETQTDLQATIYLAYGGFFRQAFIILRSWFELSVQGVCFAEHYEQPSSRYRAWRQGVRDAPTKMLDISRSLSNRASNILGITTAQFLGKLDPLYSLLSKQAHGKGLDVFDLQDGRDNVPRFLERSYDLWFNTVLSAFDATSFLYRAFFVRELRAYLSSSNDERERALNLAVRLSASAPEFNALVAAAT